MVTAARNNRLESDLPAQLRGLTGEGFGYHARVEPDADSQTSGQVTVGVAELDAILTLGRELQQCPDPATMLALIADALPSLGPFAVAHEHGCDHAASGWRMVIDLHDPATRSAALVVRARMPPTPNEVLLLELLSQHAAAVLTSAPPDSPPDSRGTVNADQAARDAATTIATLSAEVAHLRHRAKVHDTLGELSVSGGGDRAIAEAVHHLTGLPVGIEDSFGNLRVWVGKGRPSRYRRTGGRNRDELIRKAATTHGPLHEGSRILHVIRPRYDVLGIVYLCDPENTATDADRFALSYGSTVLALVMSHQRALAETEERLRRDLGTDLLEGTDEAGAYSRADALGYDLRKPQRVMVAQWTTTTSPISLPEGLRRCAAALTLSALHIQLPDLVALIVDAGLDPGMLYRQLSALLGSESGIIAVGSACGSPADLPRSLADAIRALEIRRQSRPPTGIVRFDELGVYRILASRSRPGEVEAFVDEWLGPLLDYDRLHHSSMIATLREYLDLGGNYNETAHSLQIHRSTLRYRLARIHELSGRDLRSVDTRLNLHLAVRALHVLSGSERQHKT